MLASHRTLQAAAMSAVLNGWLLVCTCAACVRHPGVLTHCTNTAQPVGCSAGITAGTTTVAVPAVLSGWLRIRTCASCVPQPVVLLAAAAEPGGTPSAAG